MQVYTIKVGISLHYRDKVHLRNSMNSKKCSLDRKNTISHKMSFPEFNLLSTNSIVTVVQKQVLVISQEDVESESAGYLVVFRITSLYVGGRLSETVEPPLVLTVSISIDAFTVDSDADLDDILSSLCELLLTDPEFVFAEGSSVQL